MPVTSVAPVGLDWIRPLATPYLRGYRAVAERSGALRGYWFLHPASARPGKHAARKGNQHATTLGFFVGYLTSPAGFEGLSPEPPECLVFVQVGPAGGSAYRRLAATAEGLLRKTFTYIRWLTHRLPRFVFQEENPAVMVRHESMRTWPAEMCEHRSRNFYIETLAWLVRSSLVRKLLEEGPKGASLCTDRAKKTPKSKAKTRATSRTSKK